MTRQTWSPFFIAWSRYQRLSSIQVMSLGSALPEASALATSLGSRFDSEEKETSKNERCGTGQAALSAATVPYLASTKGATSLASKRQEVGRDLSRASFARNASARLRAEARKPASAYGASSLSANLAAALASCATWLQLVQLSGASGYTSRGKRAKQVSTCLRNLSPREKSERAATSCR